MEKMQTNEVLRQQGFTQAEIDRLSAIRQVLREQQIQQATVARRRLEFARWLVTTGKITDQAA